MSSISIIRGDDVPFRFQLKDRAYQPAQPVNITGWQLTLAIKLSTAQTDQQAVWIHTWTSHTDPVNGISEIVIPKTVTKQLVAGTSYLYGLQALSAAGLTRTVKQGQITVTDEVVIA